MARPQAIMPIADDLARGHNWMIYGDAGSGKTPLITSGPKTLIVRSTIDNVRTSVLRGHTAEQWVVDTHDDLVKVEEYIRHEGHKEFEWCWLDTLTLFQDVALHDIMLDTVSRSPHRKVWAPDKPEYRDNMNRMQIFIRSMVKSPINFGLTAHVMKFTDREGNEIMVPYVHGKGMWEKTTAQMGMVGYLKSFQKDDDTWSRTLYTAPHEDYFAKDSYDGAFKGRVVDPDMPKLLRIVGNKVAKVGTPGPELASGAKKAPAKKAVAKAAPVKKAVAKKASGTKKPAKKVAAVKKASNA